MNVKFEKERIYSLDVLRIMATVCILFHHFQQNSNLKFDTGINYFFGWFGFGYMVELFFVLSGFFTCKGFSNVKKMSFAQWIRKRYLRLIPLVALSVIVYELLVLVYVSVLQDTYFGSTINLWGALITALGVQDGWVFINPVINNPVWYISVLLLCYIIFYFITYVSEKCNVTPVYGFVIMILIGCAVGNYNINLPFLNLGASRGYYSFFSGGY